MAKVSIIMGAFRAVGTMTPAMESILAQTYSDWELWICDDGSGGDTYRELLQWKEKDARIHVLQNEKNRGLAQTLNLCLEQADGRYIMRLDTDDKALPSRMATQVAFLEAHSEYAMVGSALEMFDEDGVWGKRVLPESPDLFDVWKGHVFAHPSMMIRTDAIKEVGGYTVSDKTRRTEDYDLWCKLYAAGYRGYNLREPLTQYYESTKSYGVRKFRYAVDEYHLRRWWAKKMQIPVSRRLYVFRPIIAGLVPAALKREKHRRQFAKGKRHA